METEMLNDIKLFILETLEKEKENASISADKILKKMKKAKMIDSLMEDLIEEALRELCEEDVIGSDDEECMCETCTCICDECGKEQEEKDKADKVNIN
jgi:hypothetical protein